MEGAVEEEPRETTCTRLVNKQVQHRFETDEGTKWWRGKVISQVKTIDIAFYNMSSYHPHHYIHGMSTFRRTFCG